MGRSFSVSVVVAAVAFIFLSCGAPVYAQGREVTTASQTRLARDGQKAVKSLQRNVTELKWIGNPEYDSVLVLIEHEKTGIELLRASEKEIKDEELRTTIRRMIRERMKELTKLKEQLKRFAPASATATPARNPFRFPSPEEE